MNIQKIKVVLGLSKQFFKNMNTGTEAYNNKYVEI